jgi:hypothetical protein
MGYTSGLAGRLSAQARVVDTNPSNSGAAKAYNDRDHLHPSDAGYKAMTDAVDLNLLRGK